MVLVVVVVELAVTHRSGGSVVGDGDDGDGEDDEDEDKDDDVGGGIGGEEVGGGA